MNNNRPSPVNDNKQSGKSCRLRGSFTVEASLIMTLLLPVLMAVLYLAFADNDRGVLMGEACEITAIADNNLWKKDPGKKLEQKAADLAKHRLLCSRNLKTQVSLSENSVKVSYNASFTLPGLLPNLFQKGTLDNSQERERRLLKPADTIRKIRGLEYLIED